VRRVPALGPGLIRAAEGGLRRVEAAHAVHATARRRRRRAKVQPRVGRRVRHGTGDRAGEELAQILAAELDPAIELTRAALALCTELGDRHREAALRNNLADLLHATERRDEAMHEPKRAVAIFAEIAAEGPRPEVWKLARW
jgi:hypothetical protein